MLVGPGSGAVSETADAAQKSNSAVNDLPTGSRAELRHKDLRGAASTTCPGVLPSVLGAP